MEDEEGAEDAEVRSIITSPPTSAATAVNRLKNLVGAGSGRASGVDTDEEMATAAARTTISGE